MGPLQVAFLSELSLPLLFYMCWFLFWCMLSVFRYHAGCHINLWGFKCWGLHHCSLLELTHGRHMCNLVMVTSPHQECTEWLLPPLLWVGEPFATHQLYSSHSNYMVGHTALGAWQRVTQSLNLPAWWGRGLMLQVWLKLITQFIF